MPEIFDWYKRPPEMPEINTGDEIVEKEGYIPADQMIDEMISAGIRLNNARKEMYDYENAEDVPVDAVPTNNFPDVVDAQMAMDAILARGTPVVQEVSKVVQEVSKDEEPSASEGAK